MMISPLEDRLYAVFFYILAALGVLAVGVWIYWLNKKAKNKNGNR